MGGSFRTHSSERQQRQGSSDYRKLSSPKDHEAAQASSLNATQLPMAERLHPSPYRYSHATISRSASGGSAGGSHESGAGGGSGGGPQKRPSPRRRIFEGEEDSSDVRSLPLRYYASRRSIRSARAAEGSRSSINATKV